MTSFANYPKINAPFALNDPDKVIPNSVDGFTASYSTPRSNGGTQITRHQMNGFGYLATAGAFLDMIGYPYGNNGIHYSAGGYPKGAIVTMFDGTRIKEFVNTIDNNSNSLIVPDAISDESDSQVSGWEPLYRTEQYNFFPDYTNRELISSNVITSNTFGYTVSDDRTGWILVRRTINNWDDITVTNRITKTAVVKLVDHDPYANQGDTDDFEIHSYEGRVATRFTPFSGHITISGSMESSLFGSMTIEVFLYPLEAGE